MAFNVHVVAKSDDDLLNLLSKLAGRCEDESLGAPNIEVELLEDGDGEGRGFPSTGLGLSDDVVTLDDRDDRTLLDGRRTLEAVREKASGNRHCRSPRRTRRRRYRGGVPPSDPCCRNWFLRGFVNDPGVERGIENTDLSTISSQLDSISPSGTSWRDSL